MKYYLIDPRNKTITIQQYDGSAEQLVTEKFPYPDCADMGVEQMNQSGDHMLWNTDGLTDGTAEQHGVWGLDCGTCYHIHSYGGLAIIIGTDMETGDLTNPVITLHRLAEQVQWGTLYQSTEDALRDLHLNQQLAAQDEETQQMVGNMMVMALLGPRIH